MVEPVSMGVVAVALIAKALNRAEDGVIDAGVQAARKAVKALLQRFAADTEAEKALEDVVEVPDSEKRQKALAELLEARAGQSAELREELQAIVEQIEAAGVVIGPINQTATGDGNVQNAGIVNSQVGNQGTSPRD